MIGMQAAMAISLFLATGGLLAALCAAPLWFMPRYRRVAATVTFVPTGIAVGAILCAWALGYSMTAHLPYLYPNPADAPAWPLLSWPVGLLAGAVFGGGIGGLLAMWTGRLVAGLRPRRPAVTGLMLTIGLILITGWWTRRHVLETIPNGIASWHAGRLLAEYMALNDGAWPGGWEDFDISHTLFTRSPHGRDLMSEVMERIEIDWSVDPADLDSVTATSGAVALRVVRMTDGSRSGPVFLPDGNEVVIAYLRGDRTLGEPDLLVPWGRPPGDLREDPPIGE